MLGLAGLGLGSRHADVCGGVAAGQVRDSALGLRRPDVVGRTEVRVIQQGPVADVHFAVGYPGEPLGVFAAQDIARGDFLGVMTGELRVDSDEVCVATYRISNQFWQS